MRYEQFSVMPNDDDAMVLSMISEKMRYLWREARETKNLKFAELCLIFLAVTTAFFFRVLKLNKCVKKFANKLNGTV